MCYVPVLPDGWSYGRQYILYIICKLVIWMQRDCLPLVLLESSFSQGVD